MSSCRPVRFTFAPSQSECCKETLCVLQEILCELRLSNDLSLLELGSKQKHRGAVDCIREKHRGTA